MESGYCILHDVKSQELRVKMGLNALLGDLGQVEIMFIRWACMEGIGVIRDSLNFQKKKKNINNYLTTPSSL